MALILNIETATEVCSVALGLDGQLCHSETIAEPNRHASHTTLLIQQVLEAGNYSVNQLDAVAVSAGPGSYTGLRIGASIAKGICFALDIPLIAIPSLQGLAEGARRKFPQADLIIPMIDARRQEVYAAWYGSKLETLHPEWAWVLEEGALQPIAAGHSEVVVCGNGAFKAEAILGKVSNVSWYPGDSDAGFLVPLAEVAFQAKKFQLLDSFSPFYLKPPNITKPKGV